MEKDALASGAASAPWFVVCWFVARWFVSREAQFIERVRFRFPTALARFDDLHDAPLLVALDDDLGVDMLVDRMIERT